MEKQELISRIEQARIRLEEYTRKGWFESIMATTRNIQKLEDKLDEITKLEEIDILEKMERENLEDIDWQEMDEIDRICKMEGF